MVKINYKENSFEVPESWEELSFFQLENILRTSEKDDFEVVRLVLGMEKEAFYKLPKDLYFALRDSLAWANEKIDLTESESGVILFEGELYELPKDLGNESIAQYKDAQIGINAIGENATMLDVMRFYCKIVATYLQPLINKEGYDYTKAQKLASEIDKSPNNGLQILAFGNFFLRNLLNSKNGTPKIRQKQKWTVSKKWQGLAKWLRRLVLLTRLKN